MRFPYRVSGRSEARWLAGHRAGLQECDNRRPTIALFCVGSVRPEAATTGAKDKVPRP